MASYKTIEISQAFAKFDDILDVRSPAEYADDHLPGAINLPVLSDEERAFVGALYTQVSSFEAKKHGAAMIARNIARHLNETLIDKPKTWQPLIYCWRGGMRSGAMAHILAQVGWRTAQLHGGYKAYRRHVISALDILPSEFKFIVLCGATGSGKSRLLRSLAEQGAQVLDLERLAQHRGSLLGRLPNQKQPSQKTFESRVCEALKSFSTKRPIYVEAESRKIGAISLPSILIAHMRSARCILIEATVDGRIELLLEEYAHFFYSPTMLTERLALLTELHGQKVIRLWCEMANQGEWRELVNDLLIRHYDPAYLRSTIGHFEQLPMAERLPLASLGIKNLKRVAIELINKENIIL
ncbi:MAG: tRNA 2-selenouridine(34) synthase MnmH [Methylophilaceae bacterium]